MRMTRQQLLKEICKKHNLNPAQSEEILNTFVENVCYCLGKDETVELGDFGTWSTCDWPSQYYPEVINSKVVIFQPGKAIRDRLTRR